MELAYEWEQQVNRDFQYPALAALLAITLNRLLTSEPSINLIAHHYLGLRHPERIVEHLIDQPSLPMQNGII